jgi:hypothetical protein
MPKCQSVLANDRFRPVTVRLPFRTSTTDELRCRLAASAIAPISFQRRGLTGKFTTSKTKRNEFFCLSFPPVGGKTIILRAFS